MKSFQVRGVVLALGAFCLATGAYAQQTSHSSPSLLPLPQTSTQSYDRYPMTTSANFRWQDEVPSPPNESGQPNANTQRVAPPPTDQREPTSTTGTYVHGGLGAIPYHHYGGCPTCGGYHATGLCPHADGWGLGWLSSLFHWGHGTDCGASCCGRCGWFGGAAGLIMTRDNDNHYHFSFGSAQEELQLLDVRDVEMDWVGGVEARVGRYFCCGDKAWEVVYWGIYPGREESVLLSSQVAGFLDAILNFDDVSIFDPRIPGNSTADSWTNAADAHRLRRDFTFNNVELNLLSFSNDGGDACGCPPKFSFHYGLGLRYFQFEEDLLFSAKEAGSGAAFNGGIEQLNYSIDVENHLIGAQLGGAGQYQLWNRLSLTFGGKLGLYGNHMNHQSVISSAGNIGFVNNGPLSGADWNIRTNKDDVAFLGELNAGLDYQIKPWWSATLGYRALAVTGVALSSNQVPNDLRGVNDALVIDSNGSLILHGAYAGMEFNY